jgi:hypothetical protein
MNKQMQWWRDGWRAGHARAAHFEKTSMIVGRAAGRVSRIRKMRGPGCRAKAHQRVSQWVAQAV